MNVLSRYEPLIDDYAAFREACNRPLPRHVRVNTIKTTVDRAIEALASEGIEATQTHYHDELLEVATEQPGTTWPYFLGWLHGQEVVSTIPPVVLDFKSDDRIFDACAAPGSKTGQLAAAMQDQGRIIANDANLGRLSALRSNMERLGVTNIAVTNRDARHFSLRNWSFDRFDGAIVDAPCSGEGTVRKNPAALEDWSEEFLEDIATLQKDLLKRAVRLTKPGGSVVYSTCTYAPEENEGVVDAVLETENCEVTPFEIPIETHPGITEWNEEGYVDEVSHARRVWPHVNDTGGFFCAKLEVTE